jgi:hypothetical protein
MGEREKPGPLAHSGNPPVDGGGFETLMDLEVLGIRSQRLGGEIVRALDARVGEPAGQEGEVMPIGPDGQWSAALVAKPGGES